MTVNNETRSRFVIRPLDVSHIEWVSAIFAHSHLFHNKAWRAWLPERNLTALAYEVLGTSEYLMRHQLESGYSLGMFDTEYQFKNPDSAPTGGKLWWDDENANADGQLLLEQMDFPLVSIALAYDSINPLDPAGMAPLIASLPPTKDIFGILAALDPRDPATWYATAPGQVLFRNATNTRADYEGHGLMARMARHMMFRSAEQGFRAIQIECMNNPVTHVWSHPLLRSRARSFPSFKQKHIKKRMRMAKWLPSWDQRTRG